MRFFTKQMKDRDERPVYRRIFSLMECGSKQKPARESKDEAKCNTAPYWQNVKATSSKDILRNERKPNYTFDYTPKRNFHQVVKFVGMFFLHPWYKVHFTCVIGLSTNWKWESSLGWRNHHHSSRPTSAAVLFWWKSIIYVQQQSTV